MMKILFLAYYFPPVGGSGVQRALKFVQYLPLEGFLPVVVAGPGGPASPEDRWAPRDSSLSALIPPEVSVHRVPAPPALSTDLLKRRLERWLALRSSFEKWWVPS